MPSTTSGGRITRLIVFHVMAEEELTFPFKKFDEFKCLEIAGRRVNIDPARRSGRPVSGPGPVPSQGIIELACGQMEADYVPVNTNTPVTDTLLTYFSQRKALTR